MGFLSKLKEKLFKKTKTVKEQEVQDKYVSGLDKSRKNFVDKLAQLKARYNKIDDEYFEELEQILLLSDVGVDTALNIVEATRQEAKLKGINEPSAINEVLVDKMFIAYANNDIVDTEIQFDKDGLTIVMVVGVNGVGKTTSIGKISASLKRQHKKVVVAAADTFRAAAIDQLAVWTDRAGVELIKHTEGSDPAAVVFDAINAAKKRNADVLIIDTAGRLHNKKNLMNELSKIDRVISLQNQ